MNFAACIVDNFIMLRLLHPQDNIFGLSTLQKKTTDPKAGHLLTCTIMIEELVGTCCCKIVSHAVHCHAAEAAILKNLHKGRGDPGQVRYGTVIFRSFSSERERRNTSEHFHLFGKLSGGMSCTI